MISKYDTAFDEPKAYEIKASPAPGERFIIKHWGKWYAQDENDLFYGPYENPLDAVDDDSAGRPLRDIDA